MKKALKKLFDKSSLGDKEIRTFTKKWVTRIMWFGCLWITLSYVLAFMGRDVIADSLSINVAKIIIGTMLGYLCKSFFETRSEEYIKYLKTKNELGVTEDSENSSDDSEDEDI